MDEDDVIEQPKEEKKDDQLDAKGVSKQEGEDSQDANLARPTQRAVNRSKVAKDPYRYSMTHQRRGTAIIISNQRFQPQTGMSERTGTTVDAAALHRQLSALHFDVRVYEDLTCAEMKYVMQEAAAEDHTDADCFACAILSHGEEGKIYGVDATIEVEDLTSFFKGNMCLTLAGKPKLFFIQACRGNKLDHGIEVLDAAGSEDGNIHRIPAEADFLMAYSVVPGYFSWRNSVRGSWFVQALTQVLNEYGFKLDILSIMTRVNRKVAYEFESNAAREYMNKKKQIPCIVSMLTKDLFFTQK